MPSGMARNKKAHHCRDGHQSPTGKERKTSRTCNWIQSARIVRNDIWLDRSRCSWTDAIASIAEKGT